MDNTRTYGAPPFTVAVVHGGPGAPGEMAPVARTLAPHVGVLEPLQTACTLDGQVQELQASLQHTADLPVTLIGWSWGAWLSFMLAARHPESVKKLILVGCGPFETGYAAHITGVRLRRLSAAERADVLALSAALGDPAVADKSMIMARVGTILAKADAYDPLLHEREYLECQYRIHQRVWAEADAFRRSGELLALGTRITCPVVALHGDFDPHPAEGVKEPLARVLADFQFVLLQHCGHCPWIERRAKDRFFQIIKEELE
ncbi:MAG TPA: alpha/beta hydrolase [Methanomicrobia archaeon]|nr:alpha/beta hydrolase [Methanomicrobia archaeon]